MPEPLTSHSKAEENYLKAVYMLSSTNTQSVSTSALSEYLANKPAAVSDMIQKLERKGYVDYTKYRGTRVSKKGLPLALQIIRRHRLWEVFLYEKLGFDWSEVHEVAEQLEHIASQRLIDRLDAYLGYPRIDPHGDSIPNADGMIMPIQKVPLSQLKPHTQGKLVAVQDSSSVFLRYMDKIGLCLGMDIEVLEKEAFDESMTIAIGLEIVTKTSTEPAKEKVLHISKKVSESVLVVVPEETTPTSQA